jgi:hypothetical protein
MNEVKMEKSSGSPAGAEHPKRVGFKPKARTAVVQQPKFEGRCDGLKGFTFDCTDSRQTTGFSTSIKELAEYFGRTYTYGGDIRWTVENEKMFPVPCPKDVAADDGATIKRIWERRVDEYAKRENKLAANCDTVFSLILGQCSEYMRAKLEGLDSYEKMKGGFDTIALIKAIKGLTYQFDGQKYHSMALHQAKNRFYNLYQGREMTNAQFLDKFQTCVAIVDQLGGDNLGRYYTAVKNEIEAMGKSRHPRYPGTSTSQLPTLLHQTRHVMESCWRISKTTLPREPTTTR